MITVDGGLFEVLDIYEVGVMRTGVAAQLQQQLCLLSPEEEQSTGSSEWKEMFEATSLYDDDGEAGLGAKTPSDKQD